MQGAPILYTVCECGFLRGMMSYFIIWEALSFQALIISQSRQEAKSQLKSQLPMLLSPAADFLPVALEAEARMSEEKHTAETKGEV